jgi:hypothetical protein
VGRRLGFRTERIQPLNLQNGVSIRRRLPLYSQHGHAKLEIKANLCLPEPEVRKTRLRSMAYGSYNLASPSSRVSDYTLVQEGNTRMTSKPGVTRHDHSMLHVLPARKPHGPLVN